jgi:hypothetical protein
LLIDRGLTLFVDLDKAALPASEALASAANGLRIPIYHPTFEEGLKSALRQICQAVKSNLDDLDEVSPPGG